MVRKFLSFFISLIAISCAHGVRHESNMTLNRDQFFLEKVAWKSPPPQAGLDEKFASARIIRLRPNSEFAMLGCVLLKIKGTIVISIGDGQCVWLGSYKKEANGYCVSYRLYWRSIGIIEGEPCPGPFITEHITLKKNSLILNGVTFKATTLIDEEDFESYIAYAKKSQQ